MGPGKFDRLCVQIRDLQPFAAHIEYVDGLADDPGGDEGGIVVEGIVLARCIERHDNLALHGGKAGVIIAPDPCSLDQVTDFRDRVLLQLAGKHERIGGLALVEEASGWRAG